MRRFISPAVITVFCLFLIIAAFSPAFAKPPKVGDMAPPFELTLVDGTKVSSADLRGKVVVLNFWATWCGPCKKELPTLDGYYVMQEKYGLKIFAITTEDSVPLNQLKKLFAVMAMSPVRKIKGPFGVLGAVPTNYVIDRSGRVRFAAAGAFDLDKLNEVLVPLLREPVPAPITTSP